MNGSGRNQTRFARRRSSLLEFSKRETKETQNPLDRAGVVRDEVVRHDEFGQSLEVTPLEIKPLEVAKIGDFDPSGGY
jgi:hypothetical protein